MKTCLVSLCYLEGEDRIGNNRLARNQRYLRYYLDLKKELGFDKIILIDNASPDPLMKILTDEFKSELQILHFKHSLTGGKSAFDYPYCWRGLYTLQTLITQMGYEKIILCDSDCFILNSHLSSYIRDLNSGWVTFWCASHNFPEASVQVLCPDAHRIFNEFVKVPSEARYGTCLELALPYTYVNREFSSDRFGEKHLKQEDWMDLYCQGPLDIELKFNPSWARTHRPSKCPRRDGTGP